MNIEDIDYKNEYILVVDDEESVRTPIALMLEYLRARVQSSGDPHLALRALQDQPFTFLITDIRMPGMNGLELIRRGREIRSEICAIAMTGYSKEYNYMDVINAGANDFINKPFGLEELQAKIKRAILERNIRQELNRLSVTDSLTGLYNHRHFFNTLEREVKRAQRRNHDLALLMFDLDGFKAYNDTYGHLAGDEVLRKVGKAIASNVRDGVDAGFRYGGDEFAVILVAAGGDVALMMEQRIGKAIEEECGLRVSSGYAVLNKDMTVKEMVETADQALYSAKRKRKT